MLVWVALVVGLLVSLMPCRCLAADPFTLLLKALGPVPLSYNKPQLPPYTTYQNAIALREKPAQKAAMVERYVYSPSKFDDLAARYELCQTTRSLNTTLLLHNGFDDLTSRTTMDRVMREYLRRIYQGYSAATLQQVGKSGGLRDQSLFDMTKNAIVNYQPIPLSERLEARVGYDVVDNATRFSLVSPVLEGQFTYVSMDQTTVKGAIPENIVTIDQAMDQFAQYDRMSVSVAHTFSKLGLRLKTRYGIDNGSLDYGFSKSVIGPVNVQVVREENHFRPIPGFLVVQLTMGARF